MNHIYYEPYLGHLQDKIGPNGTSRPPKITWGKGEKITGTSPWMLPGMGITCSIRWGQQLQEPAQGMRQEKSADWCQNEHQFWSESRQGRFVTRNLCFGLSNSQDRRCSRHGTIWLPQLAMQHVHSAKPADRVYLVLVPCSFKISSDMQAQLICCFHIAASIALKLILAQTSLGKFAPLSGGTASP